jgi:hypothetical protein
MNGLDSYFVPIKNIFFNDTDGRNYILNLKQLNVYINKLFLFLFIFFFFLL